jgi:hypothetical protein
MAWEYITKEAIAEAVRLSSQAFLEHADEYVLELTRSFGSYDKMLDK